MKKINKKNAILALVSISGVITAVSLVTANTIQKKNMRSSIIESANQSIVKMVETPTPTPTTTPIQNIAPKSTAAKDEPVAILKDVKDIKEAKDVKEETVLKPYIAPTKSKEITSGYSADLLVFSNTYSDYRLHLGIDFVGEKNAPIYAVHDGIVKKSEFDYEVGNIIEIEHKDGIKSVYKNLSTDKMAEVGKVVKQGDVISGMGDTGIFEQHMPVHLHFEILKDGQPIDPTEVIKEPSTN